MDITEAWEWIWQVSSNDFIEECALVWLLTRWPSALVGVTWGEGFGLEDDKLRDQSEAPAGFRSGGPSSRVVKLSSSSHSNQRQDWLEERGRCGLAVRDRELLREESQGSRPVDKVGGKDSERLFIQVYISVQQHRRERGRLQANILRKPVSSGPSGWPHSRARVCLAWRIRAANWPPWTPTQWPSVSSKLAVGFLWSVGRARVIQSWSIWQLLAGDSWGCVKGGRKEGRKEGGAFVRSARPPTTARVPPDEVASVSWRVTLTLVPMSQLLAANFKREPRCPVGECTNSLSLSPSLP